MVSPKDVQRSTRKYKITSVSTIRVQNVHMCSCECDVQQKTISSRDENGTKEKQKTVKQ